MRIEFIVLLAISLDLMVGDPRWFPHPVKLMGKIARRLEPWSRKWLRNNFFAGLFSAIVIYALSFFIPYFILQGLNSISPLLSDLFSIYIIYSTIALKDLINHSMAVYHALKVTDLNMAREKVGMIVGRDTKDLSREEIIRACVESVAENMVDGVTAPLFFAVFGGPCWALLYRSINTLDSLFGYKNERYKDFGLVSAKVDDLANFIPARMTSPLISLTSLFLQLHPLNSLMILKRDGRNHPSPNSGLPEAAVAGALGVRFGGVNFYKGIKSVKPYIGEKREDFQQKHIILANRILLLGSLVTCAFYFLILTILKAFRFE